MNRTQTVAPSDNRARFQHEVDALLNQANPNAHQMMALFGNRSESFTALRDEVVDHYFNELPSHPTACAHAMRHLVDSVLDTIHSDLNKASASPPN